MNDLFNSLISIILPVYNGEKYLSQSIESVLNQTYKNIELIIVNDCSTDTTLSISSSYAALDSRIKIINNKENKKLPASLNIGHKQAKGDFITWTSDDNFYNDNALEVLLNAIVERKGDVVYSGFSLIDLDNRLIRVNEVPEIENIIFGNIVSCCFLYKRQVFERNQGYNENLFLVEDYDFWLRAILHSRFIKIKENLYNYRKHDKSLTHQISYDVSKKTIWIKNVDKMYFAFWRNFTENYYIEMIELSTKSLMYQEIDFNWLIINNHKIKKTISKLKQNQNFRKNVLGKSFLNRGIEIMTRDNKGLSNFSKSIFLLKNFTGGIHKNAIKTLIKYSFFK